MFRFRAAGFTRETAALRLRSFWNAAFQSCDVLDLPHLPATPFLQDRVCILETRLMCRRDRTIAGFQNNVECETEFFGPLLDIGKFRFSRSTVLQTESVHDSITVLVIVYRTLPCFCDSADSVIKPGKSDFLDVADALMPVLYTGFDQIFDQNLRTSRACHRNR